MCMSKNRIMSKQIQGVVDLGRRGKALQRATDTSSPTSATGNWTILFYNLIYQCESNYQSLLVTDTLIPHLSILGSLYYFQVYLPYVETY